MIGGAGQASRNTPAAVADNTPPMRVLAVDCSTPVSSIALLEGPRIMGEWTVQAREPHNRQLLKSIDRHLQELGWTFEQLDGFAAGIGPGSFTGLRIGVTTLKTLAWAAQKPFAGICSLDALAAPLALAALSVCSLIDARKEEVYCALYQPDGRGGLIRRTPYLVEAPERLLTRIELPTIFCGDGWPRCRDLFSKELGDRVREAPGTCQVVRAGFVGELARQRFQAQQGDDPVVVVPLYVRPSEAEIQYPHLRSSAL